MSEQQNVSITIQPEATLQEVYQACQQAVQSAVMRGVEQIDNGHGADENAPIQVHRVTEDAYVIAGIQLQYDSVQARMDQLRRNPPPWMVGEGTNIPLIFQHGPPIDGLGNGITIESLLSVCKDRLGQMNVGEFKCGENDLAILQIDGALDALSARMRRVTAERREAAAEYRFASQVDSDDTSDADIPE